MPASPISGWTAAQRCSGLCRAKTILARPILHVGKFTRGLGRFAAVDHVPPGERPDDEYPMVMTTGRVLYHWHGGEMTRRASGLLAVYPEALIEVSVEDAQRLGIADGDLVRLVSRRGAVEAKAWMTDRVSRGLVFTTFHFPDQARQLADQRRAPGPGGQDPGVQGDGGAAGTRCWTGLLSCWPGRIGRAFSCLSHWRRLRPNGRWRRAAAQSV